MTNGKKHSIISYVRGSGGIGRRARLRGVCIPTYGFKSRLPHQTGIIRTLSNQGSYFSLRENILGFRYLVDKQSKWTIFCCPLFIFQHSYYLNAIVEFIARSCIFSYVIFLLLLFSSIFGIIYVIKICGTFKITNAIILLILQITQIIQSQVEILL